MLEEKVIDRKMNYNVVIETEFKLSGGISIGASAPTNVNNQTEKIVKKIWISGYDGG